MKIVFWGTPKYAAENLINIVKAGHEVIAVVTQPDRKRGRGKELSPTPVKQTAIDLGIPVFETKSVRKDQNTKHMLMQYSISHNITFASAILTSAVNHSSSSSSSSGRVNDRISISSR